MVLAGAYIAQPNIAIDGNVVTALGENLIAALVEETSDGLYRCELTLNNFGNADAGYDYLYFERDIFDFGSEIGFDMGSPQNQTRIFEGRITALEADYAEGGGARITILAEDALQDLRMTRRTRTFEDMSDEDIINEIASDHGLNPDLQMQGPTHHNVAQVNLSDLAFIRQRARRVDVELWVEGQTLFTRSRRDRADDAPTNLLFGANLLSFSVRADLAHQCSKLQIGGWDVANKEAILETADESAITSELNPGEESGSAVLDEAFGERVASVVHRVPLTTDEARKMAEAEYRQRARKFVTGRCVVDGDAEIFVGRAVDITRVGKLFNGAYYVSRVCHTYDRNNGFRTELNIERPGIGT